jgi:hypothetical protein
MTTLSRQEIEALDKLAEKATPGELRLSMSGYSIRAGWGDEKKILATAPRAALTADANGANLNEWINNAEFWCALVNAWPQLRDLALSALDGVVGPREFFDWSNGWPRYITANGIPQKMPRKQLAMIRAAKEKK